jgi:hypothetical protein
MVTALGFSQEAFVYEQFRREDARRRRPGSAGPQGGHNVSHELPSFGMVNELVAPGLRIAVHSAQSVFLGVLIFTLVA